MTMKLMYMNYKANKARAVFVNAAPSMTDQSQAADTDVNVIVKKYAVHGTAPGMGSPPMYLDFTAIPENLRAMMEEGKKLRRYRANLPEQLREKPLEELLLLSKEDIEKILTPPKKEGQE